MADFYFDLKLSSIPRTWFQAPTAFALRDVESDVSEKFSRLTIPYSTTLNNSQRDSTLFSEMLSEIELTETYVHELQFQNVLKRNNIVIILIAVVP